MDKDEIIIDILEKINDKVEKTASDVQEIKVQQALHDAVVKIHESRSTNLESRTEILEKDAAFFRNFVKTVAILAGIATFIQKIYPWIQSHL